MDNQLAGGMHEVVGPKQRGQGKTNAGAFYN